MFWKYLFVNWVGLRQLVIEHWKGNRGWPLGDDKPLQEACLDAIFTDNHEIGDLRKFTIYNYRVEKFYWEYNWNGEGCKYLREVLLSLRIIIDNVEWNTKIPLWYFLLCGNTYLLRPLFQVSKYNDIKCLEEKWKVLNVSEQITQDRENNDWFYHRTHGCNFRWLLFMTRRNLTLSFN